MRMILILDKYRVITTKSTAELRQLKRELRKFPAYQRRKYQFSPSGVKARLDVPAKKEVKTKSFNFQAGKLVKEIIRNPYAWPGGYAKAAITTDGAMLCHSCVKDNYREIIHSTTIWQINDGWQVSGIMLAMEADSVPCDHCGHSF